MWRPGVLRGRWRRLAGPDPGLLRLRTAARTLIAVGATAAILGTLVALHRVPVLAAAVGASFALMGATLPREARPGERLVTLAAMALSAAVSTLLCLFAARWPLLAEAGFLATVVATVALQSWGQRFVAVGVTALLDLYLVLFLRGSPADAAPALLGLGVALAAVLAAFLLLPEDARAVFARIVVSVRRSAAVLLHALAKDPGSQRDQRARLRQRQLMVEVNATILAAEERLAVFDPAQSSGLGLALLQVELALTDLIVSAGAGPLTRNDRVRLRVAATRLHAGRPSRPRRRNGAATPVHHSLARFEAAAARLDDPGMRAPGELRQRAPERDLQPRPPLAWRPAARAGTAALLAMAGGYALSPNRWFWSVQTAYLMFLGTRSSGDTFLRSVQRVWGTVAGIIAGVAVSAVLSAHPVAEAVGVTACLFALAYVFGASQTLSVFFVTVVLSIAYSLGSTPVWSILLLRLEETAIGAAAAIVVGLILFPTPTHGHVGATGRRLLAALAEVVRASSGKLDGDKEAYPVAAMRRADRVMQELRGALAPLRAAHGLTPWIGPKAELPVVLVCMFWARHLAGESEAAEAAGRAALPSGQLDAIASRLEALGQAGAEPSPASKEPAFEPLRINPAFLDNRHADALPMIVDDLEAAVDHLERVLRAEGWTALVARRPL